MSRKLIVDAQIFQTPAWHRGMGKYSVELLHAVTKTAGGEWSGVDILLSEHLDAEAGLLEDIRTRLPGADIVSLDLLPNDFADTKAAEHNRGVIDGYLAKQSLNAEKIDYLVLSLMQREICPVFPSAEEVHRFLLFYDLIPLLLHDDYLKSAVARGEYLPKIAELLRADHYFAISKTVANDLALYLGIDKSRITNINGGPIDHSEEAKTVEVDKPFILMPTGNDPRKNNRRAIIGFSEFNKLQGGKYMLVVTSFFSDREKEELGQLDPNVYFTGNVSGPALSYLYEQASAVLFPSEHEGLGLPILEAVERNKPVACSNIAVFHEISPDAFHYFEPRSIIGVEQALNSALSVPVPNKAYKEILSKYRWENTAQTVVETMRTFSKPERASKVPFAVFGPDPAYNPVSGRFMQECHGELSRGAKVHYYFGRNGHKEEARINYLPYVTKTTRISGRFDYDPRRYESTLYHISNDEDCAEVLIAALAVPGTLILHDTKLDEPWHALLKRGLISEERYQLEKKINAACKVPGTSWLGSLLKNQKHVIVFSGQQKELIEKVAADVKPELTIAELQLPSGNLVYPESMPQKTIDVGEFLAGMLTVPDSIVEAADDYRCDETFSKTRVAIFDKQATKYQVLSAMRFGVVPIVARGEWRADLSSKTALQYKTVDDSREQARLLLTDSKRYSLMRSRVSEYVQQCSMQTFTETLCGVLEEART